MNIDTSLIVLFANYYKEMKRKGKSYIPDTAAVKEVMLPLYGRFVADGLTPIEDLSHEEKVSLTTECRATGNKFTNKTLIEQCKILYLLRNVTKINS